MQLMLNGYRIEYNDCIVNEILDDYCFLTFSSSDKSSYSDAFPHSTERLPPSSNCCPQPSATSVQSSNGDPLSSGTVESSVVLPPPSSILSPPSSVLLTSCSRDTSASHAHLKQTKVSISGYS